jgi:hypothetical protein
MNNLIVRAILCSVLSLGTATAAFASTGNTHQEGKVMKLLRAMVISWDITESGGATIDPEIPYGSNDMLADVKRIGGVHTDKEAITLHRQTQDALDDFLRHAQLRPGNYSYANPLENKRPEFTIDILVKIDPKQEKSNTVTFEFTEQHLKLLRAAVVRWNEWDEEEGEEFHATPGLDPKRPYGSATFFYKDMADALGIDFKSDDELLARKSFFLKLHHEMQPALQVFLKYAEMPASNL